MSPEPWNDAKALLLAANIVDPALIQWPNDPWQNPEPPVPWLKVEAVGHMLEPVDIGADVWQEDGTLYVDVNVPSGSGDSDARVLAKQVANTYRGLGARGVSVSYTSASIGAGEVRPENGNWWTLTVSIDWRYQDSNVAG